MRDATVDVDSDVARSLTSSAAEKKRMPMVPEVASEVHDNVTVEAINFRTRLRSAREVLSAT